MNQLSSLDGNVVDREGREVPGALVYVFDHTGQIASLFDASGASVANPVVAGEDGYWSTFVANEGYYTLRYFWQGRERLVEANRIAGRSPIDQIVSLVALAEALNGETYPDTATGIAATEDQEMFAVGTGSGTVAIYLNDNGVAVFQRELATSLALASTDAGKGASLVSFESGNTVQDLESNDADKGASLVGVEGGGSAQDIADGFIAFASTLAEAQARTFPAWIKGVHVLGYTTAGDGGGGFYLPVGAEPSHLGKWQDGGAQWFELDEANPAIEQFGAVGDAVITLSGFVATTATGTGNADAIEAAWAYAAAKDIKEVSWRTQGPFGIERPLINAVGSLTFGKGISPHSAEFVALSSGTWSDSDAIFATRKTRASYVGFRLYIPTDIYNGVTGTGTSGVGIKVNGIATYNDGGNLQYHNRIHHVDVFGGYKSLDLQALEGEIKKTSCTDYMIGCYVSGADNNFEDCIAALTILAAPEPHTDNIGFVTTAGCEGKFHSVRNRTNFHLQVQRPIKFFAFDDSPYETGCFFDVTHNSQIFVFHTRTGEYRVDPATEIVYLLRFLNSRNNDIHCAGVSQTPSPATNIFMMAINDSPTAETDGVASINRFHNYHFDFRVAENQAKRNQARRSTFLQCSGVYVGRYCSNNGAGLGPKYTSAAAGGVMTDPGGNNVSVYLDRTQSNDANRVVRVELLIHFRKDSTEDCVLKTWLRLGSGDDAGGDGAGAWIEEAKRGVSDYTTAAISGVTYTPGARRVDFTLNGPTGFTAAAEVVRGQVMTSSGAY